MSNVLAAILLAAVAVGSEPASAMDGCPTGKYRFVIDAVTEERGMWRPGMKLMIDGDTIGLDKICPGTVGEMRTIADGKKSQVSVEWTSCSGESDRVVLTGYMRAPICTQLHGTIMIGQRERHAITGHLRKCDDDPTITDAQIDAAIDAETPEQMVAAWADPDAFVSMFARGQARLGCALFDTSRTSR